MKIRTIISPILVVTVMLSTLCAKAGIISTKEPEYTRDFMLEKCGGFSSDGQNPFFVLKPGFKTNFAGKKNGVQATLTITVLNKTKLVTGVTTRIIQEIATEDGKLVEVSKNYYAICKRDNSVVYFGEHTDIYENGVIVNNKGSWIAGVKGAKPGVFMPGTTLLGSRYYQEIAPKVALDRAEHLSISEVVQTPAGKFEKCLKTRETTPLEPGVEEFKWYAPDIGLVQDGELKLVRKPATAK